VYKRQVEYSTNVNWFAGDYRARFERDIVYSSRKWEGYERQFAPLMGFDVNLGELQSVTFSYNLVNEITSSFANRLSNGVKLQSMSGVGEIILNDILIIRTGKSQVVSGPIVSSTTYSGEDTAENVSSFLRNPILIAPVDYGGSAASVDLAAYEDKYCTGLVFCTPFEIDHRDNLRGTVSVRYDYDIAAVPLPAGFPLLLAGITGLFVSRSMRSKKPAEI